MALVQHSKLLPQSRKALLKPLQRCAVRIFCTDQAASIKKTVQDNKVVVYSKTYCPYCTEVKGLMQKLNVGAKVFELDNMGNDGATLQTTLQSITGRRTVPQVFVGGNFVGGCDDTMAAYKSGKLKQLFADAGVSSSL